MKLEMIQNVPLFADLTASQQGTLSERLHLEQFTRDTVIFREGDASAALYMVKSGWVRMSAAGLSGLANLGVGSIFGESDLFGGRPRATTATAISAVEAWALAGSDLEALVAADPDLGIRLSQAFGGHLVQMESYLTRRLGDVAGFEGLDKTQLSQIARHMQAQAVAQGESLFKAGQKSRGMVVLEKGALQLGSNDSFVEVSPGSLVGQMATLSDKPHTETASAVEASLVWFLPKSDFEALCTVIPDLRSLLSRNVRSALSASDKSTALSRMAGMPLFAGVPNDVLAAIADRLLLQHVPQDQIIFRQGSVGEAMYLVDSGDVELNASLDNPDDVLARVGSGGFFGEMSLLTGRPSAVNARAINDSNLWVLYRKDFDDLMTRYPALSMAISRALAARLADADERFVDRQLRRLPLFAGLTGPQLEDVATHLAPERYRRGETIFVQNDPGENLYLIETGRVTLTSVDGGQELELDTLHSGDFFGERSLLTGEPHSSTAVAQSDVDLWALNRSDFDTLVVRYPSLALNISRALSRRLSQTDARLAQARSGQPVAATPQARTGQPAAAARGAASAPRPAAAPPPRRSVPAAAPAPVTSRAASATTAQPGGVLGAIWALGEAGSSLSEWFRTRDTGTKLKVAAVVLLFIWLCGIAAPLSLFSAISRPAAIDAREFVTLTENQLRNSVGLAVPAAYRQGDELALAQTGSETPIPPTPTWTPLPTETPIPTNTPLPTATPTETPLPTDTPEPTATPTHTPVPPTATPQPPQPAAQSAAAAPAAAAPAAKAAVPQNQNQFVIKEMRRLSPCENKGNHNIFGLVVDAAGNPLDGITFVQTSADQIGNVLDTTVSGSKGPGKFEFTMWKGAQYAVYQTGDGQNPGSTDIARPLYSGFTDEALCGDGGGGNTLFHNSFQLTFVRTR